MRLVPGGRGGTSHSAWLDDEGGDDEPGFEVAWPNDDSLEMSRTKSVLLLGADVVAALLVPFFGYSLPPCLGNAAGQVSADCVAGWEATMPLVPNRFVEVLGVPASVGVTFLLLAGVNVLIVALRQPRRSET